MAQQSAIGRTVLALFGQLLAVVIAVRTLYEVHDAGILTASFNPAWWTFPALAIALVISIRSTIEIFYGGTEAT